ncbi:MAG: rRNA pseudouridine synthase [Oscillospiraceae bacterium]|nr:rRNA pseudouridine synthase [Oscillospiraceae bacterium]
MEERLQKILSAMGIASRRRAEEMIRDGRVRVNGNTAHIGDTADLDEDVIEVDGKVLRKEPPKRYLMLHKPRGYVTTLSDEQGRKTVAELVADCGVRVYPVGRLDLGSEGLLLMTNDGALANRMMHPKHEVAKAYIAWVTGYHEGAVQKLSRRIELDGRVIAQPEVRLISQKGDLATFEITIHEGRNRQVRRMCEAADLHVTRLRRIAEGPLKLGDLKVGTWRDLTDAELSQLGV